MKKALLAFAVGIGVVAVIVVVNAIRAGAPAPDHAEPARALATIDVDGVAQHLGEAIRFETVSETGEAHANVEAFLALHAWLEATYPGVHSTLQLEIVNGESLLYTWPGTDPTLPSVVFLAHQDVVPVEPATLPGWTHPPFSGVVADGFVWGRGALDMKSTLVALMEAMELLVERGVTPERTVHLAFGHDEEVGGHNGAVMLAKRLGERGERIDWVLDEGGLVAMDSVPGLDAPLAMIAVAEKGYLTLEIVASSQGGHSSTPPKETAVGRLARAIVALESQPFPASINDTVGEMIERVGERASFGVRLVTANRWLFDPIILRAVASSATFDAMTRTTIAPTMLEASPKENVLAQNATAHVNFRVIPGETVDQVIQRVREIVGDDHIEVRPPDRPNEPSTVSSPDSAGFRAIERSIRQIFPDAVVVPGLLMAGTDSRYYSGVADDVYRFAAMRLGMDDVTRFHGTDERIPIDTLAPMVQLYVDLVESGLGSASEAATQR